MEIIYFIPLPEITQFVVGQVGSSCAEPTLWKIGIIVSLIAGSGVVVASAGVGFVGAASIIIPLIMTGASLETIAATLGAHIALIGGSLTALNDLINKIHGVLGC